MILHHVQTVPEHIPAMQNGACTVRFLSWWRKDTGIYKTCSIPRHATLGIYWKCPICKKNGKRKIILPGGKNPIIHASAFQYRTIWHSKLMPVCFYSDVPCMCRCLRHGTFKYFMPVQLSRPGQWFKDIDSLHQSKHHVVALTCRGSASWYARLVFLPD